MLQIHGQFSPTWYKRPIHVFLPRTTFHVHLDRGPPLAWSNSGDNTCPPGFGNDISKIIMLFSRRVMSWQSRTVAESFIMITCLLNFSARLYSSDTTSSETAVALNFYYAPFYLTAANSHLPHPLRTSLQKTLLYHHVFVLLFFLLIGSFLRVLSYPRGDALVGHAGGVRYPCPNSVGQGGPRLLRLVRGRQVFDGRGK